MDLVVRKATELGVLAICPVLCERTVVKLDPARAERRIAHWRAVAVHAAQQSGRTRVPDVTGVEELGTWLSRPADSSTRAPPGGGRCDELGTSPSHPADGPKIVPLAPRRGFALRSRAAGGRKDGTSSGGPGGRPRSRGGRTRPRRGVHGAASRPEGAADRDPRRWSRSACCRRDGEICDSRWRRPATADPAVVLGRRRTCTIRFRVAGQKVCFNEAPQKRHRRAGRPS